MTDESGTLLSFALSHARKRLRVDGDDHALLDTMITSAITRQAPEPEPELHSRQPAKLKASAASSSRDGPSATSQLMGLLVAAVGSTSIVHADEAHSASSDEEEKPGSALGSSPVTSTPQRKARRKSDSDSTPPTTTIHAVDALPPALRAKARDPEALVAEVKALLAEGADANTSDADGNTPLYLALHVKNNRAALAVRMRPPHAPPPSLAHLELRIDCFVCCVLPRARLAGGARAAAPRCLCRGSPPRWHHATPCTAPLTPASGPTAAARRCLSRSIGRAASPAGEEPSRRCRGGARLRRGGSDAHAPRAARRRRA